MSDADRGRAAGRDRSPYVESQVIMTTVRVVAPFAFTYGLFLSFHGGASPGGGFQGGAIVGATVLMIAFAFGIGPTSEWLANRVVTGLVSAGVVAFALIGLVPLALGGRFLEHWVYAEDLGIYHGEAYALEAVEIVGITPIVAAAVVGLFLAVAAGVSASDAGGEAPDSKSASTAVEPGGRAAGPSSDRAAGEPGDRSGGESA